MFSSLRKLSLFSIILSILNATATILICLYISDLEAKIGVGIFICLSLFLISTTGLFFLISFTLSNLQKDFEIQHEHDAISMRALKKRVETIEKKLDQ